MLQVGIQLYSVRNHMAQDWRGTLEQVAAAGFTWIEPANHYYGQDEGIGFGVSAGEMRDILDDTGLKVCNTHIYPIDQDNALSFLPRVLDYQLEIGSRRVTDAMAYFKDIDEVKRRCELLNKMGEACKEYGVDFMYHNHYHEFQVLPGETETVFDHMLEWTEPELVKFELDTYWTARGAQDVPAFIERLGSRLLMLHQKDFPADCPQQLDLITEANASGKAVDQAYYDWTHIPESFTEIGSGTLPIQSYIDAANAHSAADYIILEQDFTAMDEIDSIRRSMEGFKKFTGVEW